VIHVALTSACPTEAAARAALRDGRNYAAEYAGFAGTDAPYLGIWRMPEPYRNVLHVFADCTAADLEAHGWTRQDTL
jgi:hypothetical protein